MKNIIILVIIMAFTIDLKAQAPNATSNNSISGGLGLFVFPANGQTPETQDTDELTCYNWAKQQTGIDPSNPPVVEAEAVNTSPDGTAVRTAARGAAAGAAIGAISGNAGQGAAIGAVVGGLGGARRKQANDAARQQQSQATATQLTAEMIASFNRAFVACIEGKGYSVR